ncbi:MAG: transcription termination/antitermination protein NusG [Bacilli bacterium]|nr:transcription termination/antitermination protein NusG [Bacilli bacterium]MDD4808859.1 transcription termination/antitermination protein NusG [Bacilli bacterium]
MQKEWYVVNTYSGHENKVKEKLEMRANSMGMEDYILRIIVPEQTEIEIKDGVKKEKVKKMFPGYILVEMVMSDEAWFVVRNTPGVTGFIGSSGKGAKPFPLTPAEVDKILSSMGISRIDLGNELKVDDMIKVINGPFVSMYGKVKSINMENQTIEVILDLFGQETVVELGLTEIEKS